MGRRDIGSSCERHIGNDTAFIGWDGDDVGLEDELHVTSTCLRELENIVSQCS